MPTLHMGQERRRQDDDALCGAKVDDNLVWGRDQVTCWKCVHLLLGRPIPPEPKCTEHDKLKAAKAQGQDATQLIGEFLDWLEDDQNIVLATDETDGMYRYSGARVSLIAKFFGINEAALDAEKDALLEYQRAFNKAHDWAEKEGRPFLAQNP
jgi:hypothetical protein